MSLFMQTISCSHFQTFHSETPYMKEEAQLGITISFPLGMCRNCPATWRTHRECRQLPEGSIDWHS